MRGQLAARRERFGVFEMVERVYQQVGVGAQKLQVRNWRGTLPKTPATLARQPGESSGVASREGRPEVRGEELSRRQAQ